MKQTKFLLGACLALTLAGCSDEVGITADQLPVSGDEITFGAAAGQFTEPTKRTVYGFVGNENHSNYSALAIKWVPGQDQVRVYCPNPSEQQWADYTVMAGTTGTGGTASGFYLQRTDENAQGVRWGDDLNAPHKFYSFYPLKTSNGAEISGLQGGTKVRATIPTAQLSGEVTSNTDQGGGRDHTWYVINPDMSYAMMVGTGTWDPQTSTSKNITLNYKPIVTVLDVYVNGPDVNDQTEVNYTITGVGVRSAKQPIVGTFEYDVEAGTCTYQTPESGSQDDNWAYVEVEGVDGSGNGQKLNPGDGMNVKFFLLPQDIDPSELTVYVFLSNGTVLSQPLSADNSQGSTATIAKGEIVKVLTPKVKPAETSNWMSAIGNDVLFASQLSLPGTKHSYSYLNYEYNDAWPWQPNNSESNTYNANTDMMQTYQTLDIGQQFDMGVRAFNIKVYGNNGSDIYVAGDHSDRLQLDDFLTTLSVNLDKARTEFAIVTIDFVQDDEAYTAQEWLDRVCSTIDDWSAQHSDVDNTDDNLDGTDLNNGEKDYFREVTATTTVGAMRRGIGVVIFVPGDQTNSSSNVNIVNNYDTSVQQTALWHATMKSGLGSADITIQNLEQNNNPTLNQPDGLYPYFITEQNVLNKTPMDLIAKKKELITQLMRESWSNNNGTSDGGKTSHLYINDLSGFCVVNDADHESTGWADAEWAYSYLNGTAWGHDGLLVPYPGFESMKLTDYRNYANYTFFTDPDHQGVVGSTPVPDSPTADNQTALRITGRGNSVVGNGGNNALLAQEINPYAESEIRRFVNDGRTPLGIVYMSFAGTPTVTFNNVDYDVNGTTLPALIVANNFKFALATKSQTQQGN